MSDGSRGVLLIECSARPHRGPRCPSFATFACALCFLVVAASSCCGVPLTLQKGASSGDAGVRYVIIVSVDGLRPDAIGAANAKSLLSLMSAGARAVGARTISRSETLPAHAS